MRFGVERILMQALAGIKVIDFSKWLPGQYCSMVLGDFGAEIIKIEDIGGDGTRNFFPQKEDGMSYWHLALNRNKKGMAVDLRTSKGKEIALKLIKTADVLIEGFRPGFMVKAGLDYETVVKENPRLVYCSLTGFGQTGKYKHKPAHDLNVVGLAGMTYLEAGTGGATVSDIQFSAMGGAFNGVSGVLLALLARERTGRGQHVDIGLFNAAISEETTIISSLWGSQEQGVRPFGRLAHYYNIYRTKDGRYLSAGTIEPKFWRRMCELIGREDIMDRQMDFAHEGELCGILAEAFAQKTQKEWLDLIGNEEFCLTPICSLQEALSGDLVAESQMLAERQEDIGTVRYVKNPIKMSATPATITRRAPRLGEHNAEILGKIGYNSEQIEELIAKKIINDAKASS